MREDVGMLRMLAVLGLAGDQDGGLGDTSTSARDEEDSTMELGLDSLSEPVNG